MRNELEIFKNEEFGEIRTVENVEKLVFLVDFVQKLDKKLVEKKKKNVV